MDHNIFANSLYVDFITHSYIASDIITETGSYILAKLVLEWTAVLKSIRKSLLERITFIASCHYRISSYLLSLEAKRHRFIESSL
jgi:hypothetical protein